MTMHPTPTLSQSSDDQTDIPVVPPSPGQKIQQMIDGITIVKLASDGSNMADWIQYRKHILGDGH